jgi:hypothetical protein
VDVSGSQDHPQTWEGVLIYEIGAKFQSTSSEPRVIDPDDLGGRLRQAIEDAVTSFDSHGEIQVAEVRYAGSRGSTRYQV